MMEQVVGTALICTLRLAMSCRHRVRWVVHEWIVFDLKSGPANSGTGGYDVAAYETVWVYWLSAVCMMLFR